MKFILTLLLIAVTCCNCSLIVYNCAFVATQNFQVGFSTGNVPAVSSSAITGSSFVLGKVSGVVVDIGTTDFGYLILENGIDYVCINGLITIVISGLSGSPMYLNYFDAGSLSVNTLMVVHE